MLLSLIHRSLSSARTSASRAAETPIVRAWVHRNFSASNRRAKIENQWLHRGYDRRRHSDINRSTGRYFFAFTTLASAVSIFIMGNMRSEVQRLEYVSSQKEE
mmetsp:Transcript_9499/g.28321  ORF Transcript_9499/g.28321 Transcript_9499/m.28321 type:complete len:103 (-) Transcript_9499:1590-1898(-)